MSLPFLFDTNNPNLQNPETGETHLLFAIAQGDIELACSLVERGADVNLSNLDRTTPLMLASSLGMDSAMELLLDHGAELEAKDHNGFAALHHATSTSVPIFELLVARGASLQTKNLQGASILHTAANASHGQVDVAKLLLDEFGHVFFVEEQDGNGNQPVHWAAGGDSLHVAEFFLDRGALVNCQNNIGEQPLHSAARHGKLKLTELFLDRGAVLDCRDSDGTTPLMDSAFEGHLHVCRALLLRGAEYRLVDNDGDSALNLAVENDRQDVAALLRAWPSIQVLWTVRSSQQVRHLSRGSAFRILPEDLCRLVGAMLV
jgi:ankyrin repeat protein